MSPVKTAFQQFLLFHFADKRRLTVNDLVARTLPKRMSPLTRRAWSIEIELACELLSLQRLLTADRSGNEKAYVASARVLRLLPTPLHDAIVARFAAPVAAAMLAQACATSPFAGTTNHNGDSRANYWGDTEVHPAPLAPTVQARRPGVGGQIEQFPRETGSAVYRMCYEDCPVPTPKHRLRVATGQQPAPVAPQPSTAMPFATLGTAPTVVPGTSAAPVPPPAKTPAGKGAVNMNEVLQRDLANSLAATLQDKPRIAVPTANVATEIPDETPRKPVRNVAGGKAHKEAPARSEAPAKEPKSVIGTAPQPTAPTTGPAAGNVDAKVAQATIDSTKPASSLPKEYVSPKLDPNANATQEERARIERLMKEARDGRKTPPAATTTPTAPPGTGAMADPGMKTVVTTVSSVPAAGAALATPVATATSAARPPLPAGYIGPDPRDMLEAWAQAWTARDSDRYFAFYTTDVVAHNLPASEFIAGRSAIIKRQTPIDVKVTPLAMSIRGNRAIVRFWQVYNSPSFRSRVVKAVELVREGDGWKIRRERLVNFAPFTPTTPA